METLEELLTPPEIYSLEELVKWMKSTKEVYKLFAKQVIDGDLVMYPGYSTSWNISAVELERNKQCKEHMENYAKNSGQTFDQVEAELIDFINRGKEK